MKSFLPDAVYVITSAASTQHPGSFVHDSLQPVEEVLWSSSQKTVAVVNSAYHKAVLQGFRGFERYSFYGAY